MGRNSRPIVIALWSFGRIRLCRGEFVDMMALVSTFRRHKLASCAQNLFQSLLRIFATRHNGCSFVYRSASHWSRRRIQFNNPENLRTSRHTDGQATHDWRSRRLGHEFANLAPDSQAKAKFVCEKSCFPLIVFRSDRFYLAGSVLSFDLSLTTSLIRLLVPQRFSEIRD